MAEVQSIYAFKCVGTCDVYLYLYIRNGVLINTKTNAIVIAKYNMKILLIRLLFGSPLRGSKQQGTETGEVDTIRL